MENNFKIKPITTQSKADLIELHLKEYFKERALSPGDSIPKEVELAKALGVSRNSVREALSRFRMLGIIESKTKTGMVLGSPDIVEAIGKVVDLIAFNENSKKELFEIRIALEIGISDFLFMHREAHHLQTLEEIVAREAAATTIQERIACDIDFHSQLFKMTNNATFIGFQKMLRPIFRDVLENLVLYQNERWKNIIKHKDLLHILKHGTSEEFRDAMREHLSPHIERLKNKPG